MSPRYVLWNTSKNNSTFVEYLETGIRGSNDD